MRFVIDAMNLIIGVVAVGLTVLALFTQNDVPLTVLAASVAVIAFAALVATYLTNLKMHRQEMKGKRATSWASALPKVSQSILELANSVAPEEPQDATAVKRQFQTHASQACYSLANAFSQVTGRECRVTLVETWYPGGGSDAAVKRLASSGVHRPVSGTDWVSENSDFDEIFKGADHFFSNDLPSELAQGYRNSHWTRALVQEMKRKGQYPYRATIVWPVQALVELDGEPAPHTVGFLCVDSKELGAFEDTIDTTVGEMVARAFYAVWPKTVLELATAVPKGEQ